MLYCQIVRDFTVLGVLWYDLGDMISYDVQKPYTSSNIGNQHNEQNNTDGKELPKKRLNKLT